MQAIWAAGKVTTAVAAGPISATILGLLRDALMVEFCTASSPTLTGGGRF